MSMHLEGPWLSTTGKKKGKQKFRNAEQARKARDLQANWEKMLKSHGIDPAAKRKKSVPSGDFVSKPHPNPRATEGKKYPSLITTWAPCTKVDSKVYTGTAIKGIGTMHKSNMVPIFSDEDAIAIAKMRR